MPYMCYEHPTGEQSILKYPNVFCGTSDQVGRDRSEGKQGSHFESGGFKAEDFCSTDICDIYIYLHIMIYYINIINYIIYILHIIEIFWKESDIILVEQQLDNMEIKAVTQLS